jgi:hypothetical protein
MITQIKDLPDNMVGFIANGEITESEFINLVMPKVAEQIQKAGKLNYLLVFDIPFIAFYLTRMV